MSQLKGNLAVGGRLSSDRGSSVAEFARHSPIEPKPLGDFSVPVVTRLAQGIENELYRAWEELSRLEETLHPLIGDRTKEVITKVGGEPFGAPLLKRLDESLLSIDNLTECIISLRQRIHDPAA